MSIVAATWANRDDNIKNKVLEVGYDNCCPNCGMPIAYFDCDMDSIDFSDIHYCYHCGQKIKVE